MFREKIKKIFDYLSVLFLIVFISFFIFMNYYIALVKIAIWILIYWSAFYLFHLLWTYIRKKERKKYNQYLILFWMKVINVIVLLCIILFSFWYYQNYINPALVPNFTISNWKKTVVFQAMSHIWSKDFYESIKNNLINHKKNWYVYYFEGVWPWSEKNYQKFDKAIWIKFDKDLYKNFSELYWVTYQDNSIFLWLVNDKDYNVDVTIDQIIALYEKIKTRASTKNNIMQTPIDASEQIIDTLSTLWEDEKKVLVFINQSLLNMIIKNDSLQGFIKDNFSNKELYQVILDERNKVLADKIINSSDDKIFITYWLLHFSWVIEILKNNDPNWKIIKTEYLKVIN